MSDNEEAVPYNVLSDSKELPPYGVIGDPHQGFKAYDTIRRTEEACTAFETAVQLLYNAGVRTMYIPGDLTDDTVWPNWVERRTLRVFKNHPDVKFIVLGGNHDSTKTYSSVSALDVLGENANVVVLNDFSVHKFRADGLDIVAIPHMKSQTAFVAALKEVIDTGERFDICLLHCMVDSNLDLGPNDLNIDASTLEKLGRLVANIWIGHQHLPQRIGDNAWIPGSTFELNFGELGERFVYVVKNNVPARLRIPQPRLMQRIDIIWTDVTCILDTLANLDPEVIYKAVVSGIPVAEYSAAAAAMDACLSTFKGDLVYELNRTGHKEVEIKTIDASFDLVHEFESYCHDNGLKAEALLPALQDAIAEVAAEEEDLSI